MADDSELQQQIKRLIDDEHRMRDQLSRGEISPEQEREQLRRVEVELDRCWDLLRQRRAKREYGADPGEAAVRSEGTVEGYLG